MTRISLFALAFASVFVIAASPLRAQELWLFSGQHDVRFSSEDPRSPHLDEWTIQALNKSALGALLSQGVFELALVGSPQDGLLEARALGLQEALQQKGFLSGEAALPRLRDSSVREGRLRLGLRLRPGGAACPGWTLGVQMPDLFGEEVVLRIPALRNLTLSQSARIMAIPASPQTAQARPSAPFFSPAEVTLSERRASVKQGPGRDVGDRITPSVIDGRETSVPLWPQIGGAPQRPGDCSLSIGVAQ